MALAEDAEHAFLLESVIGGERLGRYSFLGVGEREVISARGHDVVVESGSVSGEHAEDPLRVVGRAQSRPSSPRAGIAAVRGRRRRVHRLRGSDELRAGAPAPQRRSSTCRTSRSCIADVVVAFDHARRVMQVIAPTRPGKAPEARLRRALRASMTYLRRIDEGPRGAELGAFRVSRCRSR